MNLPQDPFMLLSVINMKLRDEDVDFPTLCRREDLDAADIQSRLSAAGFNYDSTSRRFI